MLATACTRRRVLLTGLASALAAALPQPTHAQRRVRSFAFADGATSTGWTPFTFYREGQIFVEGTLGAQPAQVWLDSGASGLVLHRPFAERLGVPLGPAIPINTVSGQVRGNSAGEQTLHLGNLAITTRQVIVMDLSAIHVASGRAFDIMLGRDLFEQLDVDIDFETRRWAVHHPDHFEPPAGARAIPLKPRGALRSIPVAVEGRPPVDATFDLGSNAPLILSPTFVERERLLDGKRTTTILSGGAEGANVARMAIMSGVSLGGTLLPPMSATIPTGWRSPQVDANVGIGLLSRFRLITDYRADRLYLVPAADAATRPFRRDRAGLRVMRQPGRLKVMHIGAGSPAEAAGWTPGVEIVAVNTWAIGSPEFTEERSFWATQPAGTEVRFRLADGSERRLTLADYF